MKGFGCIGFPLIQECIATVPWFMQIKQTKHWNVEKLKIKLCQGINQEFTVKSFRSDYVVKDVPKSKKGVRCLLLDRISQSCFFNQ